MRLKALGPLRVAMDDDETPRVSQPRRLALLAFLALAHPRGLHSRDTLVALLWPESSADQGRHALRSSLHAIRKALGDGVIRTAGNALVGVDYARITSDVDALEADLAAGRIVEAVDTYAELLTGFHVSGAPEFERWLDDRRASLRQTVIEAALRAAERHRAAGEATQALHLTRQALRIDPDDERVLRRCLALSAANGDLSGAQRSYRSFVLRQARDYDAEPADETVRLMTALSIEFAGRNSAASRTTIAVLPIMDASVAQDLGAFCDTLWDGIARRLARRSDVRALARGVVSAYADGKAAALVVARELSADIVVMGQLRVPQGSDDVEIRLEVIDGMVGAALREVTLRAQRHNLFVLEGPLASAIAPEADAAPPPAQPPSHRRTDAESYMCYARGTFLFLCAAHVGGRLEDLHASREWFERALTRDPEFAPAYSGLSNYFAVCAARNILTPFAEHFLHAIALGDRALELDATQAIPHVHYGVQAMYLDGDWTRAGQEFHRAVALDPDYAEGRRFLGIYLGAMGSHDDGIRELREAVRIEPRMPQCRNSLADALLALGRYDEAASELRVALKLDASYQAARTRLVRCLERSGQFEAAIEERRAAGDQGVAERFAQAFLEDGPDGYRLARAIELREQIQVLARRAAGPPASAADLLNPIELTLALAYAELGEWDEALAWENMASIAHLNRRQWFIGRPELQPIRSGSLQLQRTRGRQATGRRAPPRARPDW